MGWCMICSGNLQASTVKIASKVELRYGFINQPMSQINQRGEMGLGSRAYHRGVVSECHDYWAYTKHKPNTNWSHKKNLIKFWFNLSDCILASLPSDWYTGIHQRSLASSADFMSSKSQSEGMCGSAFPRHRTPHWPGRRTEKLAQNGRCHWTKS